MTKKNISLGRHARDCRVCRHRSREAIEREFVAWESPSKIAKLYRVLRSSLYLHVAACGLLAEREKNVKRALSNFIERCSRVRPTAAALVSAVVALSKINETGQTIERVSFSRTTEQFANFTRGELEAFARDGVLPDWYAEALSTTANASKGLLS